MKALVRKDFYYSNYGTSKYFETMKEFKNKFAGHWVDIDTECLFSDQYNTTKEYGSVRLLDRDIVRVVDDVRTFDTYQCPYCGFKGSLEEMKKHKEDALKQSQSCKTCKHWDFIRVGDFDFSDMESKVDVTENSYTKVDIHKCVSHYEKACATYGCTYKECAKAGLKKAFDNSLFLHRPYGNLFEGFKPNVGFISNDRYIYEVGSYVLEFNMNNYELVAYNSRTRYETTMEKVFQPAMHPYFEFIVVDTGIKVLNNILYNFRYKIDDLVRDIKNYNKRVSEDWRYVNPDGTMLNEITVNNEIIQRPKTVYWKVINDNKEEE